MTNYFTCLLFESHVNDDTDIPPLTEESIRLIVADDDEVAWKKAEAFGKESEHQYLNENGATVSWTFVRVVDLQEFYEESIIDGVEVYSRLNRTKTSKTEP